MFALCCVQKPVPGQISAVIETPPIQSLLYKPFNDTLDKLELSQEEKSVRTVHTADTMGFGSITAKIKPVSYTHLTLPTSLRV